MGAYMGSNGMRDGRLEGAKPVRFEKNRKEVRAPLCRRLDRGDLHKAGQYRARSALSDNLYAGDSVVSEHLYRALRNALAAHHNGNCGRTADGGRG